jgi:tetratricopeptide (TPR) repeat protein
MRSTLFIPVSLILILPIFVNLDASTLIMYPLLGMIVGVGIIVGSANYQASTTNNQPSKKSKSEAAAESNQSQSDTKQTEIMGLRNKADELLIEADSLENDRRFAEANDLYQEATERYGSAVEQCDDEKVISELNDELEIIEQKRNTVKQISEILPEVQEALELGESSLQTAIAAHVNEESTIARIRYRQARDQYQMAIEQIEETDIDLFTDPIEIAVNRERSVESRSISDIFELTANEEEKIQFKTISDIQREEEPIEVDDGIILPRTEKLLDSNSINRELAYQLTALHFLHEEDTFQFTSEKQIESRLQQAISGYNATK